MVGHEYRDRFDVCFKVTSAGQQIATVLTFKGINLKEKVRNAWWRKEGCIINGVDGRNFY